MSAPSPWRPLGSADWRAEVGRAVDELMGALAIHTPAVREDSDDLDEALLFSGRAGVALSHACFAELRRDERHAELAVTRFDEAATMMSSLDPAPSLLSGFTGIGWLGHLLATRNGTDDPSADLDEALLAHLASADVDQDFDLVWGASGYGLYALARRDLAAGRAGVVAVIDHLERAAHHRPDGGIAWFRPVHLLHESRQRRYPAGLYDVGVAHGCAGVLGFLARAFAAGIERDRVRRLLEGASAWLWRLAGSADGRFVFPAIVGPTGDAFPSRFGWCYGDLGVAMAIFSAARALGDDAGAARAIDVARTATTISLDERTVGEPWLCHGAAGVAHLFNRFHQATGEGCFAAAAHAWFDRCLAMRRNDLGLGGLAELPSPGRWPETLGLLTGVAGVALALHGATVEAEPAWDDVILAGP